MPQNKTVHAPANTLELNREFSAALFKPDAALPKGVIGPRGKKAEKRFAVYRNNVIVSLINALADIFPAIRTLLGEKSFADLARVFITRHPPTSPLLFEYGDVFPEFVADFKPLAAFPVLADLSRLERAWLDAFHAGDAATLDASVFAAVGEDRLGKLIFNVHPATALIESNFAIVTLITLCRQDQPLDDINPGIHETALVTRPADSVEIRALSQGEGAFFGSLLKGQTLGEAAELASTRDAEFDLSAAIITLIQSGAFKGATTDPAHPSGGNRNDQFDKSTQTPA